MDRRENDFLPEGLSVEEEQKIPDLKQKWDVALLSWKSAEYQEEATVFASRLQNIYGKDTSKCALYHLLAGSGMTEKATIFDFSGRDSIEEFILECYRGLF